MNSKKLWLSAVVLTMAGIFVGRASSKLGTATALYFSEGTGICTQIFSGATIPSNFTTGGTTQISFKTANDGTHNVKFYAASACTSKPVQWKP